MHALSTSFVLGYHGCDATVAESLLSGKPFRQSNNSYDWLGSGIYFWEANPRRGLDFARETQRLGRGPRIARPAVVGAVVELGLCLDLATLAGIEQVKIAHAELMRVIDAHGGRPPQNNPDGLRRHLDCAVIRYLHELRARDGKPPVDSVKGIFIEGKPIFDFSGFHEKTHVQICVRNPDRIKGVFRVPEPMLS